MKNDKQDFPRETREKKTYKRDTVRPIRRPRPRWQVELWNDIRIIEIEEIMARHRTAGKRLKSEAMNSLHFE